LDRHLKGMAARDAYLAGNPLPSEIEVVRGEGPPPPK
jgi:hypothetical protein